MPRPRWLKVEEAIRGLEKALAGADAGALGGFGGKLKEAALADMAGYAGEAVSAAERAMAGPGVHRWREGDLFTCLGWTRALYPYRRDKAKRGRRWAAFGVERKMTRAAVAVSWLGVSLGSFREAREAMARLGLGKLSVSKVRAETLAAGKEALLAQESPAWDKREYTEKQRKVPEGGGASRGRCCCSPTARASRRSMPTRAAARARTAARRGRGSCGSRRCANTRPWTQVPIKESFSYAVLLCTALELKGCVKKLGEARGARTVPRMQCGADGEEALETILTGDFPGAVFFNDFMHAASYLSVACHAPGIPDPDKEFKVCRAIMKRHGAASAIKRLKRLHGKALESSEEAKAALAYLEKRQDHMNYGWLRKHGYYIGTSHVEAAARLFVARRCKQAGMHWRVENAACVCALLAACAPPREHHGATKHNRTH